MFDLLKIFRKKYHTLNRIEILHNHLLDNYKYLSSLNKKIKIAPVLKSNGYGHGIINVAKILDPLNTPFFCVDSLHEAYQLQKANIKTPILIMGYTNPQNLKIKKLPFAFTVFDIETAQILNQYQQNCSIHIFVDTGMHREGIRIDDLPEFLKKLKLMQNIKIEGLMSHLSSSKSNNDPLFVNQINNFKKSRQILAKFTIKPKYFHIAASGALINPQTFKIISRASNLSRAGIALYGLEQNLRLKPALRLISQIAQIKKLKKGEKTGYEGTFTAKKDMMIGILPIGYNDGVDRRLSNISKLLIKQTLCPILGRISMNITTVDISKIHQPYVGQEVIVYSENKYNLCSLENSAKLCKTIPYDLLIRLDPSIKRVVI